MSPRRRSPLLLACAVLLGACGAVASSGPWGNEASSVTSASLPQLWTVTHERNDWRYIVLHHSATAGGSAAGFDRAHRARGWDELGYHFVITNGRGGLDGALQVGNRWRWQKHGAHAGPLPRRARHRARNAYNEFGIGICLVGNLDQRPPTRAQLHTLARLIKQLRHDYEIPAHHIVGHGHVRRTACPGRHFPWRQLTALLGIPLTRARRRPPAVPTTDRCPWCWERWLARDPSRRGRSFPAATEPLLPPPPDHEP